MFGWLNFIPRVGGRATYYSEATGTGATTDANTRTVLNTGAELTFKASQTWPGIRNQLLDLDGVRHIIEPSVNYVYVPKPSNRPKDLPQFDYELPSLRMLPLEFTDYNSIDSIDSENVIRFGLKNKLQTKRDGQVDDFLRWEVFTDWRLQTRTNQMDFGERRVETNTVTLGARQNTFSDLYSDFTLKPRSWLRLDSQTRFDVNVGQWRMLLHTVTLAPNDTWSWTVGHFYLRSQIGTNVIDRTGLGEGNNLITSSLFYRLNENWGVRANHHFDARNGRMQEQFYTLYRDLRSWTAALTAGVRDNGVGPKDYTIAFTFSLKASPKFPVGGDTVNHLSLLGR
jgi:hypothetical protein